MPEPCRRAIDRYIGPAVTIVVRRYGLIGRGTVLRVEVHPVRASQYSPSPVRRPEMCDVRPAVAVIVRGNGHVARLTELGRLETDRRALHKPRKLRRPVDG